MNKTKRFPFDFPVADIEDGPIIKWDKYKLSLEFTSYQCELCVVEFEDVPHFKLVCEEEMDPDLYPYDGVVEVFNSSLIKKLYASGEFDESDQFKHIVIGLNEISSYLIIVFKTINFKNAEGKFN
ncbi:hypothetical protein [Marinicella rhabdoformis]|uniref:hypothetical protein n=1 Tax=Marinicella rhabdoformis TaxID=2580566 RepID=UPI0012AEC52C|nr:hypothetical protein [Marinicella rhabdoformis]